MAVNPTDAERTRAEEARIAQLYQLAATEAPSPHLDAVIAAASRQPVGRTPQHRDPPWWHMWRLPVAVAAVAVVSVSLVTLMMDEGGERLTSVPSAVVSATPERDRQAREDLVGSVQSQAPERRERVIGPAQSRSEPAKVESKVTDGPDVRQRDVARTQDAQRSAADARPAASPQHALSPPAVQSKVAEATAVEDRALAPTAPALSRQEAPIAAAEGRAAPAPAARAAAPAAVGVRASEAERVAALAPRPSPEVAAHIAQLEGRAPALWIERIVTLRRDGRRAEADGLLSEFRRRFPEEILPPSLH